MSFERISLQQLSAFAYQLQTIDPALSLSELRLAAAKAGEGQWDVELSVSYLLFSPATPRTDHPVLTS